MEDLRSVVARLSFSLWRRRWLALAVAWVLCLGGWFGVAAIPNQYESSARIYVDVDAVLTPLLKGLALDNTPASQLDLLQHTLLSRPNLEKVVSKTDLDLSIGSSTDLERVVAQLAQNIKLTPQSYNLFTISYRNSNPDLAYHVVDTMVTIFKESEAGSNRIDMNKAREFLKSQLQEYEDKLRLSEQKRAEFRLKYFDLLPSDSSGLSRLESARNTLQILDEKLKDAQQRNDMLGKQLAGTPETLGSEDIFSGGGGGGGNPQLAEAQRHLAELRLRFTDQHPDVIAARQLVESLKSAPASSDSGGPRTVTGHTRGTPNPVYQQLKLQMFDSQATIASLQREIEDETKERDRLDNIARSVPGLLAQYADLNRDYDVLRKNHEELLARRESMNIATAADTQEKVKLDVVDPPQVPRIPVAPKRMLLDAAVLGLGLAGGIGCALMLLQFDSSFQTTDELRKLELPVAGSISLVMDAVPLQQRILSAASFAMGVLLLCMVLGGLLFRMYQAGVA
jgi:polysaccharide chain length determinant protein (PEP-CTERM system associated)